jgi:hypothetical protein
MRSTARGDAQFYTAEGERNLIGKNEGRSPVTALTNLEMVAGPATHRKRHSLILPYRFELIREVAA